MDNFISAQELKRRGISAVDGPLRSGPVHVIRRNRPSYVILSEEAYQNLATESGAAARLWEQLLSGAAGQGLDAGEITEQVKAERDSWRQP